MKTMNYGAIQWMKDGVQCYVFVDYGDAPVKARVFDAPYRCKPGPSYKPARWSVKVEYPAPRNGVGTERIHCTRDCSEVYRTLSEALLAQADREEVIADQHREAARLLRLRAHLMRDAM